MVVTAIRNRKVGATRVRIAEAALDLFSRQGFAKTTIDQIAAAAGVGRRTIFRHFATKEAILFDHLVVRRDAVVQLLEERPADEPVLRSLHAVLRELCRQGYDRRLLEQIREVLAANPRLAEAEISHRAFENRVLDELRRRTGDRISPLEIRALTFMAFGWVEAAARIYLSEGDRPMVECFDEVVAICVESAADELGTLGSTAPAAKKRTQRA